VFRKYFYYPLDGMTSPSPVYIKHLNHRYPFIQLGRGGTLRGYVTSQDDNGNDPADSART